MKVFTLIVRRKSIKYPVLGVFPSLEKARMAAQLAKTEDFYPDSPLDSAELEIYEETLNETIQFTTPVFHEAFP